MEHQNLGMRRNGFIYIFTFQPTECIVDFRVAHVQMNIIGVPFQAPVRRGCIGAFSSLWLKVEVFCYGFFSWGSRLLYSSAYTCMSLLKVLVSKTLFKDQI